jgi:hypothetical protein
MTPDATIHHSSSVFGEEVYRQADTDMRPSCVRCMSVTNENAYKWGKGH